MRLLNCIPDTFFPTLENEMRNALYIKSELLQQKYNISITDITNDLISLSNDQSVTIEDLLTLPDDELILNNPEVPFFTREPFISSSEDEYYAERKSRIMDILKGLGLNLSEDEVFEDLPFKYITDMLNIPDDIERSNKLGIYNGILQEENITLGDYYDILQEFKSVPNLDFKIDSIDNFDDYYYLNSYIPNKNYLYLLENIKTLGKHYYKSISQKLSNRGLEILLINLKRLTGVDYKFVDTDKFKARIRYGIVEIGNNISKKDLFHEYLHPFILALQKENPDLYNTLIQSPEVQELAAYLNKTEVYKDYSEEEALVRVLADKYNSNIFRDFYNWLAMLIKKILNIDNNVKLDKLSNKTTMQDIINIMTSSNIIDINSKHYILQERYNMDINHSTAQKAVVDKIEGLTKYILIYENTDLSDLSNPVITFTFKEDRSDTNQKSYYIEEREKKNVKNYIKKKENSKIQSLLYQRATNFIEEQPAYNKAIYDEVQKKFGTASSEVGTLYHKMIELFNNYLIKNKLEGQFTGDDEDSLKTWNNIKNTLSRRYLTYGNNKLYVSPFDKTIEEESDAGTTKETNYFFKGYNDEQIDKLDKLYSLLDVENTNVDKNTTILAMLFGLEDADGVKILKEKHDSLIAIDDYNKDFKKYIADLQKQYNEASTTGVKIDIEENIKIAQVFKLLTSNEPISESAINSIFTLYAQYLSPVIVTTTVEDYDPYDYQTLARVNNIDHINAYDIGDNSELYKTLIEYIQSHETLTYYDRKNFIVYLDTVLESFKSVYTSIYENYGKDCIVINEKTVGYNDNKGIRIVGTIDAAVVGKDKDDEDKVKIGILDYKTIGNSLFNSLTVGNNLSQKQLIEETIKKYGQKQYLYQELLANLLDTDISEISNALLLVNLSRDTEYDEENILKYLKKDEVAELSSHSSPTYQTLLKDIGKIDATILPEYQKHFAFIDFLAISNAVDYLEDEDTRILDPINKVDNKIIATLAAINSVMKSRHKKAVEKLIATGNYNTLSKAEKKKQAGEDVDRAWDIRADKVAISRPVFNKDKSEFNIILVPIYYDADNAVGKFNEPHIKKIENYRSLINYYIHHLDLTLQDNRYTDDPSGEYKDIKKALEESRKKLVAFKSAIDANIKNLTKDNLEDLLDLAFSMVDHKQIIRLIHNIGFSATTINSDINKKQVFATQTWALRSQIEDIVTNTKVSADIIITDIRDIEKEQVEIKKEIEVLKPTATIKEIVNGVITYDIERLNQLNDRYSSNNYKLIQLDNKLKDYTKSINDMTSMISLLETLYKSSIADFNLEKLHTELFVMSNIVKTYLLDIQKPIDIKSIDTDLSIRVAKFDVIERIINVYGSFSSMLNTSAEEVEIGGKKVKVNKVVRDLDMDLFNDLKEANPTLYGKINSLTNTFKVDLKIEANKTARQYIADVLTTLTTNDIVSKSSLKDLALLAEKSKDTFKELLTDYNTNRRFISSLLRSYHDTLKAIDNTLDMSTVEDILRNLSDSSTEADYQAAFDRLENIQDTYYRDKVQGYLNNRKSANAQELIRLDNELKKDSNKFTDAIFKMLNESLLGASKSSYRTVQLLAVINTQIEDNYVTLYSKMVQELELNTAKAKLEDNSKGLLKSISNKKFTLKEGLLNFNPFIANTTDTLINDKYLLENYKDVFDDDDLAKVKGKDEAGIKQYIIDNKLTDKYKVLKTNTLISRGKWNLFEKFIDIRGGLSYLNSRETPQSLAGNFNKEFFAIGHNKNKKVVIQEFMKKIDDTYYHFDYRYYYLQDYLKDLQTYYDAKDIYIVNFINKLITENGLAVDTTINDMVTNSTKYQAIFDRYRNQEKDNLNTHYNKEVSIDSNFVTDILLDIEKKYDHYKNKLCGVETNQLSRAELNRQNALKIYYEREGISYNPNTLDYREIATDSEEENIRKEALYKVAQEKEKEVYDKYILDFYKSYSPFSYSEQRATINDEIYFESVYKGDTFYKVSNFRGANIVYLPKVTANRENLDERFDELLEGNKEHYEYYQYLKFVVEKLHDYIPYDKRNSHNPLDLPAINESMWDAIAKMHNIKDIKNLSREDLIQLAKDSITAFIPNNYEEPLMNVNTLKNSELGDYKEYRKNTKTLSTQLDKTIQLFMFEALVFKSRMQMLPLNKMVLNLTKDTDNTRLKESANFAFIQNITSSSIRDINSKKDSESILTEEERVLRDKYIEDIEITEEKIKKLEEELGNVKAHTSFKLDPTLILKYYELKGQIANLHRMVATYKNQIDNIYNRSHLDAKSGERIFNSVVTLTNLSYNLTGQVNNLMMGFIMTKQRAMGSDEEGKAYNKAYGIMSKIMRPEMVMTISGIASNELVSGVVSKFIPLPIVDRVAGFITQMLVMSKIGTKIEKMNANKIEEDMFSDKKLSKFFALTPELVKYISMCINYNFTNDITEEGKTGKARRRLTLNEKNQSLDTKNQLVNLLKPYSYIQRAELFVAMFGMIIQTQLEKVVINGKEISFADLHGTDGTILDKYKPYVSELAVNQFRRRTLTRLTEASGNYREPIQLEKYPGGITANRFLKWVYEPGHHMFHGATDASDNVYTGQIDASIGTQSSINSQLHKSYLKLLKNSILMEKGLSNEIFTNKEDVDLTLDSVEPNKILSFINRFATNIHSNLNRRIVLYRRGIIITDDKIIADFIEERKLAVTNSGTDEEIKANLEAILGNAKYKDIRLLRQPTVEEKGRTITKIFGLARDLIVPVNHIPAKYSFFGGKLENKYVDDILNKYVNKDVRAMNEHEIAHQKALREYIVGIHAFISWSYYKLFQGLISAIILGLFDLDKDDEIYQIIQSFDNKFNKLYQDVVLLGSPNPLVRYVGFPYRVLDSLFSPVKYYSTRVVPLFYDVAALGAYSVSELVTADDSVEQSVFESIYKVGGLKHPYTEDAKGQFTNWRLVNDVLKVVPVFNRLSSWERDEMLKQQER